MGNAQYNKQYVLLELERLKEHLAKISAISSAMDAATDKAINAIDNFETEINRDKSDDTKLTTEHTIATLSKDDLIEGLHISKEDAEKIPEWVVATIAKRMGDIYMEKNFWKHLDKEGRYIINDIQNIKK